MAERTVRIVTKRTAVPGKIPTGTTGTELNLIKTGELASNLADKKLYSFDGSEVFEFGTNSFLYLTGGTVSGNVFVGGALSASTYQNLPIDPNYYVTGGTYNSGTTSIDYSGNFGFTPFSVNVSSLVDGLWSQSGSNIYYSGGNVGIGVSDPTFSLDVVSSGGTGSFEDIARFRTIDSTDYLAITNAVSTDGSFNPVLRAFNNTNVSTNFYLQSVIDPSVDTGTNPLIILQGRVNTDPGVNPWSGVTTRPILRVRNNSLDLLDVTADGKVGIGTITPTKKLEVIGEALISGSGQNVLTIIGSGDTQPLFTVQGSSGELFSVTDSLIGTLFSVNDISGLPILEVNSDDEILMGNYQAPSLNTTFKSSISAGLTELYSIPTSAYTGGFFEYTLVGSGARAGSIMSIFSGSSVNYTETTTTDIGDTSPITFDMNVSGGTANLTVSATTGAWEIKTIVRSI